jgi:hypothetical protein
MSVMNICKSLVGIVTVTSLNGCDKANLADNGPTNSTDPTNRDEPCDMNAYCRSLVGPNSYCKNWQSVPSCFGNDQVIGCDLCSETPPGTTIPPQSTRGKVPTTSSRPNVGSACRYFGSSPVPAFLWIEGTSMTRASQFIAFYQSLLQFVEGNCVNMQVTTLVIRTPNPVYPTQSAEPMYWPPSSSPLYTEFIAKVSVPVKILLYPYIMEGFDRTAWTTFGQSSGVFGGIFAFTKGWQDSNTNPLVDIEGFMIDYEEVYRALDPSVHPITLTANTISPLKSRFPSVKTATTVGYDDANKIAMFAPFMDYIHLQVYDLYYPYAGADKSLSDSIFYKYMDNPAGLLSVLLSHVFTTSVLNAYKGRESKIKLMWSTQTMSSECMYPMSSGKCGINNEFHWRADTFNEFLRLALGSQQLGPFEHGVYTYNFMRSDYKMGN